MFKVSLANTIKFSFISLFLIFMSILPVPGTCSDAISEKFVALRELDPSIIVEMRYFGDHNFVGRQIQGYEANKCMLQEDVAQALSKVQKELSEQSLNLKVYDCYRPQRAVTEFVKWARDLSDQSMKKEFYPHENKKLLIKKGYIASRSGHSRGDTVDLTIVNIPGLNQELFSPSNQKDCTAVYSKRYHDSSLDMGTGFDCFDSLSHTINKDIGKESIQNRLLLKEVMEKHGFRNYRKEWWHYTYTKFKGEKKFYDFPIQ